MDGCPWLAAVCPAPGVVPGTRGGQLSKRVTSLYTVVPTREPRAAAACQGPTSPRHTGTCPLARLHIWMQSDLLPTTRLPPAQVSILQEPRCAHHLQEVHPDYKGWPEEPGLGTGLPQPGTCFLCPLAGLKE